MRVAIFLGSFPTISETFILRQITGLIDLGHVIDIYAEMRPPENALIHQKVFDYNLLEKTTYLSDFIPAASNYWEMPVWPVDGETWIPGAEQAIQNELRVREATPHLTHCLSVSPELTFTLLDPAEYGYTARSLSAMYRFSFLSSVKKKYDVVHAHFGPIANKFRFIKQLWQVPFVVTFHGYDFSIVPLKEGADVYKKLFDTVDVVTVNSRYTADRVQALGCLAQKIRQVNVGLNLNEFPFKERIHFEGEHLKIVTVGRLTEKKGIEYAIKAIAKVKLKHPEVRYEIIGEGELRRELESLVKELGLEDVVVLHGAKDENFIQEKMAEAHLFVLPSVTAANSDQEGTPVSLMEAQAAGLPVISTLHSGIPEVVKDGETGYLIPEREVDTLATKIIALIDHRSLWGKMGRKGRQHMERNYDIKKLNQQLEDLYFALTENKHAYEQ
jgi:colanic acid/amylovoran biosynthesis glycosyltransferase